MGVWRQTRTDKTVMRQLEPDSDRPPIHPDLTQSHLEVGLRGFDWLVWGAVDSTRLPNRKVSSQRGGLLQRIMGVLPFFKYFIGCNQSKKQTDTSPSIRVT